MRKTALVVAGATVALLVAGGGAFAAGRYVITSKSQIKPSVVRQLKGNRGPQGSRGATGAPGISALKTVDGAVEAYPPGSAGAAPNANCPSGMTVVGTGFNGPFGAIGGFVQSYEFFVGGFFENDSTIEVDGSVQAICAKLPASASVSLASGSLRAERARFAADVRAAMKAARRAK